MTMTTIETYLKMTGQKAGEVLAGERQYGPEYVDNLITQAVAENKKIVFIPELTNGLNLGQGRYELQAL